MPLVNATDIPLTPYPTGRTSPQAPSDYQNIPSSPAEFGSQFSEAQSGLGKTLEQVGTTLINRAVAQQHFLNLTEQDKLSAQLDDELHKQKYGDPTAGVDPATGQPLVPGFKNRYGSDAIDYIKSGEPAKAFNDTVARLGAGASNDQVREMFLRQSRSRRAAFDNSIDEHWTQQLAVQNKQTKDARAVIDARDIAEGYDNDVTVNTKINESLTTNLRGVTDSDARAAIYYNTVYSNVKQAAEAALADEKPERAKQLYDAYKNNMTGDDRRKLWLSIEGPWNKASERAMQPGAGGGPAGGGAPGGAGFRAPAGTPIEGANPEEQRFLNEARFRESSNRYDLVHPPTKDGEVAGGAYGFLPGTWKEATAATGIGAEYPTADKAPPKAQDANALWLYRKYGTKPWAASGPYGGGGAPLEADFAKRSGAFGTPQEAAKNLTSVTAPGGASFTVHRLAAPQVQGFINELEGLGYKIDPTTSGAYNDRNKVGVGSVEKSEHAYGSAFDINWNRNKQDDRLITDLPNNVSEIAAKWGLKWGGDFRGKKDAMHFEVAQLLTGSAPAARAAATRPPGMVEPGNIGVPPT
jgi:hypothetical protein